MTPEEQLQRDLDDLLYHNKAAWSHIERAKEIAYEYKIATATGMTAWRSRYAKRVHEFTVNAVDGLLACHTKRVRHYGEPYVRYWEGKHKRMLGVASRKLKARMK